MDNSKVPHQNIAAGMADVQRMEVNAAYANLEQMIRDFVREKLNYEQKIEGLRNEVVLNQESLQKMAKVNENLAAESKHVLMIHEEDNKAREQIEIELCTVERKLEIILLTVGELARVEAERTKRYEEQEEFIYCLKFRQLQLKAWIDKTKEKNQALKVSLEVEVDRSKALELELEQAQFQFAETKEAWDNLIEEMENTIKTLSSEIEAEKLAHSVTLQEFNNESAGFNKNLNDKEQEIEGLRLEIENMKLEAEEQSKRSTQEQAKLQASLDETKTKSAEEKAELKKVVEDLEGTIWNLDKLMESQRLKSECTIQELNNTNAKLTSELSSKVKENNSLTESIKAIKEDLEKFKTQAADKKRELESAFEQEKSKLAEENARMEKQILEQEKVMKDLAHSLEEEKAAHSSVLEELNNTKSQLALDMTTKEKEADDMKTEIDKLKKKVEEMENASAEEQTKLKNALESAHSKHAEEKATLEKEIGELSQKIQDQVDQLQKETSLHEVATKEHIDLVAKLKEELANREGNIKSLCEKMDELKSEMQKQAASFAEEKVTTATDYMNQITRLNADKLQLEKKHATAVEELEKELDQADREKRDLLKRYQDQKRAISKMVEQVGVRPVILPTSKASKAKSPAVSATAFSSPEAHPVEVARVVPTTPVSKPPPTPMTPSRIGILKRHSFAAGDKVAGKSVSFGPSKVTDFVMTSSDTDESTSAEANGVKNVSQKRMKLSDEKNDPAPPENDVQYLESENKEKKGRKRESEAEKPVRRFIKRGISQKKKI